MQEHSRGISGDCWGSRVTREKTRQLVGLPRNCDFHVYCSLPMSCPVRKLLGACLLVSVGGGSSVDVSSAVGRFNPLGHHEIDQKWRRGAAWAASPTIKGGIEHKHNARLETCRADKTPPKGSKGMVSQTCQEKQKSLPWHVARSTGTSQTSLGPGPP